MNLVLINTFNQALIILVELGIGFGLFWVGQWLYQKWFRRMDLNLELFVRDNPAVATALVGYYLGISIALGGVLGQTFTDWQEQVFTLVTYGMLAVGLMLVGSWVGDRFILSCFDCARETQEEQNLGAASVEAGTHIANGLILSTALGGESGTWLVGVVCWIMGMSVLVLTTVIYPRVAQYNVFEEIQKRNNPATGVALAGLLIATGNVVRAAFTPDFEGWVISFSQYALTLGVCLIALIFIRWLADLVLVPGVKISDEIVHQETPNLGAGLIEAFSYVSASFLISWIV